MSLLRRRALLAASQTGGGGGGFKADFYFDYCEESFGTLNCHRAGDELGVACYNEMVRLIDEYGAQAGGMGYIHTVQNPINYGFEVYVEGALATRLQKEHGNIYLVFSEGEYTYIIVTQTGELICEI